MIYSNGRKFLNTTEYIEINDEELVSSISLPVKLRKFLDVASEYNKSMKESIKKNPESGLHLTLPKTLKDLHFVFRISDYNKYESAIINLLNNLQEIKLKKNYNFYIAYEEDPSYLENEMNSLSRINNKIYQGKLSKDGLQFPIYSKRQGGEKVVDVSDCWNFEKVLNANFTLNNIANDINKQDLTSYERYLAAYAYVNNYIYTMDKTTNPVDRVVEIINGGTISEAGYATLLKHLCQRVNIPCVTHNVFYKDEAGVDFHIRNIVKIKDHKYKINGIYLADPTLDSKNPNAKYSFEKSFYYHLMPLTVKFDTSQIPEKHQDNILYEMTKYSGDKLEENILSYLFFRGAHHYKKFIDANFLSTPLEEFKPDLSNVENNSKNNADLLSEPITKFAKNLSKEKIKYFSNLLTKNTEQLIQFHETIKNTKCVPLLNFEKALATVYSKVDLDYYTFQDLQEFGFSNIIGTTSSYNYKCYYPVLSMFPGLKDKATFTNSEDYNRLMGITKTNEETLQK